MSDQKKEPEFPQAQSTTELKSGCLPEITKTSNHSLSTDAAIIQAVLGRHGGQISIPWFNNHWMDQRQCRWVIPDKTLIVDIFERESGRLIISMHNLEKWVSPSDSLMPRFAKTLAFDLQSAGVKCKYQQDALQKYSKGVSDA